MVGEVRVHREGVGARTARRLGSTNPLIVYRRTRERMPAEATEVADAEEEGVRLRWLSTITDVEPGEVTVERMELGPDGFPKPTGELERLAPEVVVLALGQDCDLGLLGGSPQVDIHDGSVVVDDSGSTGAPGVFACGDVVAGTRTATAAVGSGRRVALAVDAWLQGSPQPVPDRAAEAGLDRLDTWYVQEAPHAVRARLEAARRASGFAEVVAGLDERHARHEASRCMSCGSCNECDNRYGYCPDDAIEKLGPGLGFRVDLDYCKGCGICAFECPAGAIDMLPELG